MTHPTRAGHRDGRNGYDDLEPDLRLHAQSRVGDPGREERRDRLIREFLPLVHNLSRRYGVGTHSPEDVEQAGIVGLIKAIDRYDPESARGGPLAYLVPSVRGEMLRYLRDHTWAMRVPRDLKELSVRVRKATDVLTQQLGRAPRPTELAEEIGVPVGEVVDTLAALESYQAHSLDVPFAEDGPSLGDRLGVEDEALDVVEQRGTLRSLINELPERERTILLLRFYGEQTQTRIAEQVGVSQMHVSRLLSRTIEHLRSRMADEEPDGEPLVEDRPGLPEDA
ncbi:SigB/SigF/SigG family RNA polymerase sigma factor [Pseudonocardia sp. KRD291]|uniref:SigB/SigF/SigG family RNA polymerase sigma factor n=1 Tax=Pseudonocardia sp. KRD291 TaxID=2792007 RepID=UPI001C4A5912|nr:SigB/SigF/SigG family RNA polymerase sigma factor [Pseudonocardia sp. KRD291]MBW0101324.1 SigB/SigF/SigG family RNA polymerase sigma factor [Pseudonocardia sp. KRD291]